MVVQYCYGVPFYAVLLTGVALVQVQRHSPLSLKSSCNHERTVTGNAYDISRDAQHMGPVNR